MESNIEFNGSAFTTAAVISGVAYGIYTFTSRGNNQNQNQSQRNSSNNSSWLPQMFSGNNNSSNNNNSWLPQFNSSNNNNSRMPPMNNNYRRYGGKKTKKNRS